MNYGQTPILLEKVVVPDRAKAGDKSVPLISFRLVPSKDVVPFFSIDNIIVGMPNSIAPYFHNVKLWQMENGVELDAVLDAGQFIFYPHAIMDLYTPRRTFTMLADIDPLAPSMKFSISTGPHYISASSVVYGRPIPISGEAGVLPFTIIGIEVAVKTVAVTLIDLAQNYPNPFNPTTTIKFVLSQRGKVSLKVFDALGRAVKILVNENRAAGEYQEILNARDLASGTYYYLLQAGRFKETKKMTLLK